MTEVPVSSECVETAISANTTFSVLAHIVDRRIEYLLGALLLHVTGVLDQVISYGSGMCV